MEFHCLSPLNIYKSSRHHTLCHCSQIRIGSAQVFHRYRAIIALSNSNCIYTMVLWGNCSTVDRSRSIVPTKYDFISMLILMQGVSLSLRGLINSSPETLNLLDERLAICKYPYIFITCLGPHAYQIVQCHQNEPYFYTTNY